MNNAASTAAPAVTAAMPTVAAKASTTSSRRRRVLLPLAGLLTAAALVVGSGADFVSSSVNSGNAYTTGTLTQSNSKDDSAVFNMDDLKPGDTVNGGVVLTNTGTLPASFELTEDATNGFADPSKLQLTITEAGSAIWSGTFGELDAVSLGDWAPEETREFSFSVNLDQSAGNEEQGRTATASYTWDAIQAEATTYSE